MRPTVKQLEYLLAVAETLHFRKAAELASISQPALSAQIASLEELLDVQLFERTRRQVLLTPAGRQAVARAKEALEAIDAFTEAARAAKEPLCGPLRLGLIPTIAPYLLPRVLPGLRKEFPELQLFLREEFTHVLVDRLMSGEIDVALLALPVAGDFASQSLFFDDFHVALPKGHALAERETIAEEDLNHQEVLLLEDGDLRPRGRHRDRALPGDLFGNADPDGRRRHGPHPRARVGFGRGDGAHRRTRGETFQRPRAASRSGFDLAPRLGARRGVPAARGDAGEAARRLKGPDARFARIVS
jgi:DNA-binding transcriptional LysR family regulator